MIEKAPDDRFATPGDLYRDLQGALSSSGLSSSGMGARLSLGPREKDGSVLGMSAFEILGEADSDQTGKTFRARDTHSGEIVALKYLAPDLVAKQTLLGKIQRHVLGLRQINHPNLVRILGFEKGEDGAKIATEWVRGPTLLALLKARNELPLRDVAPLLGQLASALDFAAKKGLSTVETDLHLITLTSPVLGDEPAQWPKLLRTPISSWERLQVKINPLLLSPAAQDYPTLPDQSRSRAPTAAGGAPPPLFMAFLHLVHRLLGGAGGSHASSTGGYVSIPHLGAEANDLLEAFFTPPFTPEKKLATGTAVLRELCKAEHVPVPEIFMPPDEADAEAMKTRDSSVDAHRRRRPDRAAGRALRRTPPAGWRHLPGSAFLPAAATGSQAGTRFPSTHGSSPGRPATKFGSSSGGSSGGRVTADYDIKRKELELQRQRLEAEAERLQQEEVLEQTRTMLEEERASLAAAKEEFGRLERERAQRAEQERQRLEQERAALESGTADIERKRLEQERLEQEIQLRAQLELQRFQEEKRRREEEWNRQREDIERALKEREEQYLLREQQSFRKLQDERSKIEALASALEQNKGRAQQEAEAAGREQLAALEAERQRLADEQAELQRKILAQNQDFARLREELASAERELESRHHSEAAAQAVARGGTRTRTRIRTRPARRGTRGIRSAVGGPRCHAVCHAGGAGRGVGETHGRGGTTARRPR